MILAGTCGETFTGLSGTFTSPDYPSNYPNDVLCTWHIIVPMGSLVQLKFSQNSRTENEKDFVRVYDGITTQTQLDA